MAGETPRETAISFKPIVSIDMSEIFISENSLVEAVKTPEVIEPTKKDKLEETAFKLVKSCFALGAMYGFMVARQKRNGRRRKPTLKDLSVWLESAEAERHIKILLSKAERC